MQIIVTGHLGTIGKPLCRLLLSKGYEVIGLDINKEECDFPSIQDDVRNIQNSFAESRLDYSNVVGIFHLACPASYTKYAKYPLNTIFLIVDGTREVIQFAKSFHKPPIVVNASSSEVYGTKCSTFTVNEQSLGESDTLSKKSCYSESKRLAETLCMQEGFTKIARIFNTYGPDTPLDDGRVIPAFVSSALKNEDLVVNESGKSSRSFCYADDLVAGLYGFFKHPHERVLNLGNPNEHILMTDLAQKIIDKTGSSSKIKISNYARTDVIKRKFSIDRAKKTIGFDITTSLDDGLDRVISSYQ
jgi:nucleoside-diphosphate-sugar epimerase